MKRTGIVMFWIQLKLNNKYVEFAPNAPTRPDTSTATSTITAQALNEAAKNN